VPSCIALHHTFSLVIYLLKKEVSRSSVTTWGKGDYFSPWSDRARTRQKRRPEGRQVERPPRCCPRTCPLPPAGLSVPAPASRCHPGQCQCHVGGSGDLQPRPASTHRQPHREDTAEAAKYKLFYHLSPNFIPTTKRRPRVHSGGRQLAAPVFIFFTFYYFPLTFRCYSPAWHRETSLDHL